MKKGFDKAAVYDEKISPLMKQIIDICKEEGVPMLAQFYIQSADVHPNGEELYCTTTLPVDGNTPEEMKERMEIVRWGRRSNHFAMAVTVTKES